MLVDKPRIYFIFIMMEFQFHRGGISVPSWWNSSFIMMEFLFHHGGNIKEMQQ